MLSADRDGYRIKLYRGLWCVVWREGGATRRSSLGTRDRALADRRFAEFLHRLRTAPKPEAVTIGAIYAAYRADRELAGVTAHRIGDSWKALEGRFGACAPAHVTKALCREHIAARQQAGRGDGTIRSELGYLAAALRWAEREGWIDRAPHVELPPPPPPRDRWLSHEEGQALLAAAAAPHVRLFIAIALHTAARAGAILELGWNQVNERFIDFNPPGRQRTSKGRAVVPMSPGLWAEIETARKAATTPHVIEYAGEPVASIKKGFAAACGRAGLVGVTPHTLRHTAATWMAIAGVDIRKIALFLGHSDSRTTERIYAKHSPDYLADAAGAIDAAMTPNQSRGKRDAG